VEYFITMRDSDPAKERTLINCRDLFIKLKKGNSLNVIAIFDSCFSGNVFDSLPSKINSFVVSSTSPSDFAFYPLNKTLSIFTSILVKIMREGLDNGKLTLTLGDIFNAVNAELEKLNVPLPRYGGTDIKDFEFIKNMNLCSDLDIPRYEKEINDLYKIIVRHETDLYKQPDPNNKIKADNKIFTEYKTLEDDFNDAAPIKKTMQFRKSLILKRYPIIISYLLKRFLYPDIEIKKTLTDAWYQQMYEQLLKMLSYIAIKDLADHQKLREPNNELIKKIWGPVTREWCFEVLAKELCKRDKTFLVDEFSKESDFFHTILFIEYTRYRSITKEAIREMLGITDDHPFMRKIKDFDQHPVDFRESLFKLIKDLSFFVKYNMVAIKLILVTRGYDQPNVVFTHEVSDLFGDSYSDYNLRLITTDKCYHNGTVMILKRTIGAEQALKDQKYVNLWPLIIDKNGSNLDLTRQPEIHIFDHATTNKEAHPNYKITTEYLRMFDTVSAYDDLISYPPSNIQQAYFLDFRKNIGFRDEQQNSTAS
jgi:hypothetical protein